MADTQMVGERYTVESQVGEGPLGTVHRARSAGAAGFSRRVALKRLSPELASDAAFVTGLGKGLSVLMGFPHLHVENALDLVRDGDDLWLAVEWCDGPSLKTWIEAHHERGTPAPYGQLLAIASRVLYGLHGLHGRGISHGGVGSTSIRLDRSGQPRVTRAGLRTAVDASERAAALGLTARLTAPTPEGGRPTPAGDVFAVGLVIYTALAGAADAAFLPEELRERVMEGKPVDLALLRDDVPPVLLRTIERALKPDPRERFDSAASMGRNLDLLLRALPENLDPPVIARGIADLTPAKKPPGQPVTGKMLAAPPPPPAPPSAQTKPKLGVTKDSTDRLDVSDLKALQIGEDG